MIDIQDMLGKPYSDGGRGPDSYDCYGVVLEGARRMGAELTDIRHEGHGLELCTLWPSLGKNVHPVDKAMYGVIVECEADRELHLGLALDSRMMIHATYNKGVCVHPISLFKVRSLYGIGI
ncbi:MAG: C40 family peptidase [Treponema sp.]|nr:C40 family peptidase [Treponema sp.]